MTEVLGHLMTARDFISSAAVALIDILETEDAAVRASKLHDGEQTICQLLLYAHAEIIEARMSLVREERNG